MAEIEDSNDIGRLHLSNYAGSAEFDEYKGSLDSVSLHPETVEGLRALGYLDGASP